MGAAVLDQSDFFKVCLVLQLEVAMIYFTLHFGESRQNGHSCRLAFHKMMMLQLVKAHECVCECVLVIFWCTRVVIKRGEGIKNRLYPFGWPYKVLIVIKEHNLQLIR